jgi:L-proline 3-hydroxylase-like protein/aspartyl/asparaginyl beta-hydroxylase
MFPGAKPLGYGMRARRLPGDDCALVEAYAAGYRRKGFSNTGFRVSRVCGGRGMESRILGKIALDQAALRRDVDRILTTRPDSTYAGYCFGTWNVYLLWNQSGDVNDGTLHEFDGAGQLTALGNQVHYVASIIGRNFNTERMKWARAFLLRNGHLVPHRDYLEFKKPLTRVHLALFTHESSMHSEDEEVFRMRDGEVWYLAAEKVHSAATLTDFARIVICMEFDLEPGQQLEAVFRIPPPASAVFAPSLVERPPLTAQELDAIHSLGYLINERNFSDVLRLLSKVHFYKRIPGADLFHWLTEIARRSGDAHVIERAAALKKNCIESRALNEHISVH